MLRFKDTVRTGEHFTSQTLLAMVVADQLLKDLGAECWITSLDDSQHRDGSKHYTGRAVDIRTKNLDEEQKTAFLVKLKGRLVPLGYDVIFEARNTENEHMHVEWDPK